MQKLNKVRIKVIEKLIKNRRVSKDIPIWKIEPFWRLYYL